MKKFKVMKLKNVALLLAIVMLVGGTIGNTYAWLIDKTNPVINTFVVGKIHLTLKETDTNDGDNDANTNTYSIMPGQSVTKDPIVTVAKNSADCWLFVKIEETTDFDSYLQYEVAEGWTALGEDAPGIYYMEWPAEGVDKTVDNAYPVLKDNKVTMLDTVTDAQLDALEMSGTYPQMTLTAYAIQRHMDGSELATPEGAWQAIKAAMAETTN